MFELSWLGMDDPETWKTYVQQYGYGAILLGIMLENAGIPVPGETITLTGGFLAGNGQLSYWGVLGTAIAGAIIGDNCGYWVGSLGGWPLLQRVGKFFRVPEEELLKVRAEFQRNADKAVLVGRFLALLRIFAGPLAGIAKMPYPRFLVFNSLGAVLWASVMVTLAFFGGRIIPLEMLVTYVLQFAIVALLAFGAWVVIPRWLQHRSSLQLLQAQPLKPEPQTESLELTSLSDTPTLP